MLAIGLGAATLLTWGGRRRHSAHPVFFPFTPAALFYEFRPTKVSPQQRLSS
jgi:hypothetical protein